MVGRRSRCRRASRARSSCAATPSCRATGATRRRRPRPSTPTAGCTPATSASWTRRATSPSPTGSRTCTWSAVQRLPGRDRGHPARPRGGPGGGGRRARRAHGRGGLRLRRAGRPRARADRGPGRAHPGWSREAMANYKVPRGVVLVDALPLNASGKVLKRELRERTPRAPTGGHVASRGPTRGASDMRGIVYTGEGVEVTDELEVRDPGRTRCRCGCRRPGCATPTSRSSTAPSRSRRRPCWATRAPAWSRPSGDAVSSVKPGDHVVIATLASCGTCRACSTGHPTWCRSSLGNISTPFTFKGEPASNFAAASVFSE